MSVPTPHRQAVGIHPGAFVQDDPPDTSDVQDGVLWVDTSSGPPYALNVWNASEAGDWESVGSAGGIDAEGGLLGDCLWFPHGASICNDVENVISYQTAAGAHAMDTTGYSIPGGHRLERVGV